MGVPVITIDGPSGSGKGTIAARLANHLGWRILDSGALYRLLGLAVVQSGIDFKNHIEVTKKAETLSADFDGGKVFLDGKDVTLAIRTETAGNNASKVAAIPAVRDAFLIWQRNFAQAPGLVADGRDMGTVVFPDAALKIYLEASAGERAKRRYKQLIEKGIDASLSQLVDEIKERDERDSSRAVAPLRPAKDAIVIDSTTLSVEQVLEIIIQRAKLVSTNTVL